MQIYNENIYDLLEDEKDVEKQSSLKIREDKINGIYVEDITEFLVENVYDCLNLLKRGERTRRRRQANKNEFASKTHTIFQIIVEYDRVTDKGVLKRSKLNLVDLAASDKLSDEPKNETSKISLSLTTLGSVIHSLSIGEKHIPYRDSKLTRLLQDSLGGNTFTYLICNLSPSWDAFEESINTLKFGDRAKNVKTQLKASDTQLYDENLIRNLKDEIHVLKDVLNIRKKRGNITNQEEEILKLKRENQKLRQYVLSNVEVQKIVEENKKLKTRLAKYEDTDLLDVTQNRAEADLSYHKDLSKFDPYYGDKSKIYDRNSILEEDYAASKRRDLYEKQGNDYGRYENTFDTDQEPFYGNSIDRNNYKQSYDAPQYYEGVGSSGSSKKLFGKQSPRERR